MSDSEFANQLEKLFELKEKGIISEEEFNQKKKEILNISSKSEKETNNITEKTAFSNPNLTKPKRGFAFKLLTTVFFIFVFIVILGIIIILSKDSEALSKIAENKNVIMEQIGYAKFALGSGSNNRSFVFYTTETDEQKLIEHARKQAYTNGGFTYVHYYNIKEKAPDNTLFLAEEAFGLDGYKEGRILVYQRRPTGAEFIWDGNMREATEIKGKTDESTN